MKYKGNFSFWVLCQYLFLVFLHINLGIRGRTVLK